MKVTVTEYNIPNDAFDGERVIWRIFAIVLTVSEILTFHICVLHNLGQGHKVQRSQWSYSMAYINL